MLKTALSLFSNPAILGEYSTLYFSQVGYRGKCLPIAQIDCHGWKNDLNDCYFNGAVFGADYVTCNSQGTFPELSIALTGKETK